MQCCDFKNIRHIVTKTDNGSNTPRHKGHVGVSFGRAKTHCNIADR